MNRTSIGMLCLISTALLAGCAAAPEPEEVGEAESAARGQTTYLALGDSIPFGFNPLVLAQAEVEEEDFVGYPEVIGPRGRVRNAACPGETSASYFSLTAPDTGCHAFRSFFELHVEYSGTQAAYAAQELAKGRTGFVTFAIGANDVTLLLQNCGGDTACAFAGLPATLQQVGSNAAAALGAVRASGYTGPIVVVQYYARNYADPIEVAAVSALNQVLGQVAPIFGATPADGFSAFAAASAPFGGSPCAAGLLIKLPDGTCDEHPSLKGQTLLAQTIQAAH